MGLLRSYRPLKNGLKKRKIENQNMSFQTARIAFWPVLLFSFGLIIAQRAAPEEIWLIEHPANLSIFNRYEQRLTESEKTHLRSNSPWRILDPHLVLSDQYTITVKAEFERNIYFLQTDDDGDLINQAAAGLIEKINPNSILSDTIRVSENGLILRHMTGIIDSLSSGTLLLRLFKYKQRFYVKNIDTQRYGWIFEKNSDKWEIFHRPSTADAYEQFLFDRIDRVIESYNLRLRKLFEYLNRNNQQQRAPPQWIRSRTQAYLKYTFQINTTDQPFRNSHAYLIRELSDLLYGTSYRVDKENGELVISKSF